MKIYFYLLILTGTLSLNSGPLHVIVDTERQEEVEENAPLSASAKELETVMAKIESQKALVTRLEEESEGAAHLSAVCRRSPKGKYNLEDFDGGPTDKELQGAQKKLAQLKKKSKGLMKTIEAEEAQEEEEGYES